MLPYFHSLTVTDIIGVKSDTFTLTLFYNDSAYAIPTTGVVLEVEIGYEETGLWEVGAYVVDKVNLSKSINAGTMLAIQASNVPSSPVVTHRKLQASHNRSFKVKDYGTFGKIVDAVMDTANLTARMDGAIRSIAMPLTVQFNESDANFLYRISLFKDVLVKYHDTEVVFEKRDTGKVGRFEITPDTVSDFSFDIKDRTRFNSLVTQYMDKSKGTTEEFKYGSGEPVKRSERIYPDENAAKEAATALLKELQRKTSEIDFSLPANPRIVAEAIIKVSGFPGGFDDSEFVLEQVTHSLGGGGLTSQCKGRLRT